MKSLILKGGLGNQLFQVSKFLELSKKKFNDLKIDTQTGFLTDFKYKRRFEFQNLSITKYKTNHIHSFLNVCILFINKYFPSIINFLLVEIINDTKNISLIKKKKIMVFDGYFQEFNSIYPNLRNLYKIVEPNFLKVKESKFRDLIDEIKSYKNSIALCIRFYEETSDPSKHAAKDSKSKSVDDYNKIIKELEEKLSDPHFFVFVQYENNFTKISFFVPQV